MDNIKNDKYQYSICGLFLVMLFLHLFRLGDLPYAINIDETGLWYNVKSLLEYGYAQEGKSFPLLFTNYYSEQSAMYTYLALICCKLFGHSLFVLRLPAVVNACLIFIFGAKIVNKIYHSEKMQLLYCVFTTIFPYFIINGRIALDCNLMLGFSTMFLYFLIEAVDTSSWTCYLGAGISGGMVLYTYAISYITIPLFVAITGIYLIVNKKITFKNAIIFLLPIILLGIPLLLIQLINIFEWNEIQVLGITLPNFASPRHADVGVENILGHLIVYGKYILLGEEISLLTSTIFCNNFYLISIPFLFIGLFSILKEKGFSYKKFILFWAVAYFTTIMLIKAGIRGYQTNALMFVCVVFVLEGLFWIYQKINSEKIKKIFVICLIIIYLLSFGVFGYYYFIGAYNDNVYKYENSNTDFIEVYEELKYEQNVYCAVKSAYYKMALNKDPKEHPFVYNRTYNENGECIAIQEEIYTDCGFIFDHSGTFLNNIQHDSIYVIPLKETKMIHKMQENAGWHMYIVNQYAIFRPMLLAKSE